MAKDFRISSRVREKLVAKHGVALDEVIECFLNREGASYEDTRSRQLTDPPTMWFVAETDRRRRLKVVYVEYAEFFAIKSAFDASLHESELYEALRGGSD